MNEFKFEYTKVNSKSILSESSYQRRVDSARVKKIVSNFNPNLVNPVKVSYRDNKYYVFDGQHTLKALVIRNGNKDLMVDCKVYYGMTYEDEARMFAEQNGISKAVQSDQKLKSLYEAKDVDVIEFKEAVESLGIRCSFRSGRNDSPWAVGCYSSLYKIYIRYGKENMIALLKIITEIWDGDTNSFRKEIVSGMNIFINAYKGKYDRKLLVKKLSAVSPISIYRDGKLSATGGDKRFAKVILNIYNKNLKTNKLDDKF